MLICHLDCSHQRCTSIVLNTFVCISKKENNTTLLVSLDSELYCLHLLINFIFNSLASEDDVFKNGIGNHCEINISSIDLGCQAIVTVSVTFHSESLI